MIKKSLFKRVVSVALASVLAISGIQIYTGQTMVAKAEEAESENPLTTVVKTANVGNNTGGSYTQENGVFTVNGAGTVFGKDTLKDDFFYTYFSAKGNTTVVAKVTPDAANTSGFVGLIAKNGIEDTDFAAGVYWDYSKGNIRAGRHGGASNVGAIADYASVYVKLEFSMDSVYYTVATDAEFTNIIAGRKGMGSTGLLHTTVGIFATDGNKVTVEDLKITTEYTDDLGEAVKKVVYDSATGELIPEFSKSSDYDADYDAAFTFSRSAEGNVLRLVSDRNGSANKGDIRSGKTVDYLLFPATNLNCTVSADVAMYGINSGTDKQGIAVGQFAAAADKVGSSKMTASFLQANKNKATQHNFTTAGGTTNGGNPKASDIDIENGTTYNLAYTKNADGTAVMVTTAANGTVLATNADAPFTLQDAYEALGADKPVQYGIAVSAASVEITNLKLIDSDGWVLYDQNDYYIAKGVAPVVTSVTKSQVSDDRMTIDLAWTAEGGVGNVQYIVMVAKDGGEYKIAGTSKTEEFSYSPEGDGAYKFKIYAKSGDSSSEASAFETQSISYVTPLEVPVLTGSSAENVVTLTWTDVANADKYNLYRKNVSTGEFDLAGSFAAGVGTYTETLDEFETYFYYLVAENTATANTSNPSTTVQVLTNTDRADANYLYEDEAANITITDKSNDTVFTDKASVKGTVDRAGIMELVLDEQTVASVNVAAGGEFSFDMPLDEGRNEYELLFRESADANATRMTLNFVYLKDWDITVDAAFTGTDGTEVDGIPVYKTVQAAVDSVAADNAEQVVIFVKNGDYNERVTVTAPHISILGEDKELTRIYKSVAVADGTATGMWDRNAFYVDSTADYFTMENLTIENSYNYTNGSDEQADALAIVADEVICVNLKLLGYQDTLLVDSRVKDESGNYEQTKQYFYKCYITGNVDFIYGSGSTVFDDCDIVARYTDKKADGCYTAARTYDNIPYGLVFVGCRFLKEAGVAADSYRLARPWGADASTIFISCYLCDAVGDAGYGDMSGNLYTNARFREYLTYGPGFAVDNNRLNMTSAEAEAMLDAVAESCAYIDNAFDMYVSQATPDGDNTDGTTDIADNTPGTGDTSMRVIIPLVSVMAVAVLCAAYVLISQAYSRKRR